MNMGDEILLKLRLLQSRIGVKLNQFEQGCRQFGNENPALRAREYRCNFSTATPSLRFRVASQRIVASDQAGEVGVAVGGGHE
jgi:hypothetical protein